MCRIKGGMIRRKQIFFLFQTSTGNGEFACCKSKNMSETLLEKKFERNAVIIVKNLSGMKGH